MLRELLTDAIEEIDGLNGRDNSCDPYTDTSAYCEALSTPPSTSYLEQWEKSKYGEPVGYFDQVYMGGPVIFIQMNYIDKDREGVLPLYARKEK